MAIQDRRRDGSADKDKLDLELETATKEQQIAWVCQIIQKEVEKPDGEIDYDLIQECNEFLDELTANDIAYTPEDIEQRLQKQKEDMQASPATVRNSQSHVSVFTRMRRFKTAFRVALVSAVTLTVLLVSVSIVAYAQGYRSAWSFISTNIQKIVGMNPGDRLETDGITIIKNTGTAKYATIEELLQKENIDILYPPVLPEDIALQKIILSAETNENFVVSFQFSSESVNMTVRNYVSNDLSLWSDYTVFDAGVIQFYIEELPDSYYQAVGQYNGYEYSIVCNNYANLILILDNLKGVEK